MPSAICENFSGIVLDQNVASEFLEPTAEWYHQTFRIPESYAYEPGGPNQRYPSLSGFQLLVGIANASTAALNYTIEQFNFGSGWEPLAKGTTTGAQAEGERIWMDIILDQEIPVDKSMVTNVSVFRIGVQAVSGITKIWFARPNPLTNFVEASENETPLGNASLAFRILALTADSGTDFLGNPYRSVVVHTAATNANSNSGYWLSAPQPSRFAVVNHYSDLRPFPKGTAYGTVNRAFDPSFEYDVVGSPPALWNVHRPGFQPVTPTPVEKLGTGKYRQPFSARLFFFNDTTQTTALVRNTLEAAKGTKYLEVVTPNWSNSPKHVFHEREGVYLNGIQATFNVPITFSVWVRVVGPSFNMAITIGGKTTGFAETSFSATNEWTRWSVTLIPKVSGTTFVSVVADSTTSRTFLIDGAMINQGTVAAAYIDGDSPNCQWENQRGLSASLEVIEPEVEDNAVVVNSVLVDPITPGVAFNIYYTNDLTGTTSNEPMSEAQWEQKLWLHVPQSFVTTTKNTYVLPEPITAKFVKIEFSYLQARSYNPGDFQKPSRYKQFPDWVAAPFLALQTTPAFIARRVGVAYDALELAYKPLVDDLIQAALSPERTSQEPIVAGPAANRADPATLEQINLTINRYLRPPGAQAKSSTLLGQHALQNANAQNGNYPVEGTPEFQGNTNILVSGLDRQGIVLDQSMPVMFFWVTCRHEYKELMALYEDNRAYFAGLKELAFIRDTYAVASDSPMYIETGTDDINAERSDFVIEDGDWFTY